ncbi:MULTISPECIES: class II aldolase/adducin family protein [Paraburkholderia]|uniref:class II aldolase/adducin family protein n=1 Tax=Paraburkholderia TaxID=1822464 RepID=UPI00084183DF|nr:class II aldolase/adducin family protein [Paraburkholderia nodosa]
MSFAHRPTSTCAETAPRSTAEQQLRVDLAAAYRLIALNGWDDLIYTHVSAAIPGEAGRFLINPFGLAFDEVRASNTASLGAQPAMLLRNHGTLTTGRTVAEAYVLMATLIKACEIQLQAQAGGVPLVVPPPGVAERTAEQLRDGGAIEGVLEWPALLRKLDRIDSSYRD